MKGLTHFISGLAAVSFIPQVVQRSAAARTMTDNSESSFLFALAGLFAILPDTLDFKLGRFLEKADVEATPDKDHPDAQYLADQLGKTMDQAWNEKREYRIQFNTLRYSNDRWRRYEIKFDTTDQSVSVIMGDIVTTSQVPFPGTAPADSRGTYKLQSARLLPGSTRDTTVDIMSGPMYGFRPQDNHITVDFLPWHRTWSHSYTIGAALSLIPFLTALLSGWKAPWLYFVVAFLGFATHITEDLTGHIGGSLIWPFIKQRSPGLCLFHAANPDANFVTDFIALALILFNLDRFGSRIIPLAPPLYFLIFLVGPLILYFLPKVMARKRSLSDILDQVPETAKKSGRTREGIEELESESESVIS
jgi:hypothetical protein